MVLTCLVTSQIELGPGDGTVNKRSLEACSQLGPRVRLDELPSALLTAWRVLEMFHAGVRPQ